MTDSYVLSNGMPGAAVCAFCRMNRHAECQYGVRGFYEAGECCCGGEYDLTAHMLHQEADDIMLRQRVFASIGVKGDQAKPKREKEPALEGAEPEPKKKGDSGYIDPAAWPSTRDLSSFVGVANSQSTGYKRATKMYKALYGKRCEWAGLAQAGGGVAPIVGCMGSEATDLHHGPDKNTFNNAKASAGVGEFEENVHLICTRCHVRWHAANDEFYPAYDRVMDVEKPFVPLVPWVPHDGQTKASQDDLLEIEQGRVAYEERTGKNGRQRNPDIIELGLDEYDGDDAPAGSEGDEGA